MEFFPHLDKVQKEYITGCREIRNKFIHCKFDESNKKISDDFCADIKKYITAYELPLDASVPHTLDIMREATSGHPGIDLDTVYANVMNLNCFNNYNAYQLVFRAGVSII